MSQQMINGSHYSGSVTLTNRMSYRYAVVNPPFAGAHRKPQDKEGLKRRKAHWQARNAALPPPKPRVSRAKSAA